MTNSIQPFIDLPFWTFWNGPMLSNSFKLIGAFPPFEGGNDENCGGSDGSNANPWRSLKTDSSNGVGIGLNCGGNGSENCCSSGWGWRLLNGNVERDFPFLAILLIGRRRTTLPVFSPPAMEDTSRIPNAIACIFETFRRILRISWNNSSALF